MQAADIMTTNPVTIAEEATAIDAVQLMLQHQISALPVVDSSGTLIGIVSEGDLMRRADLGGSQALFFVNSGKGQSLSELLMPPEFMPRIEGEKLRCPFRKLYPCVAMVKSA